MSISDGSLLLFQAAMETLRADPADEGQTPVSSVDVVSKVLSQTS